MSTEYTLSILNPSGDDIDIWSDFISLNYSREMNRLGRLVAVMPAYSVNPGALRRDSHILVYRKPSGGHSYLDMGTWWIIDHVDWDLDNRTIRVEAGDLLHLLKRRIVGYTSQTTYADKTFIELGGVFLNADDMMKEYVAENLGPSALDSARTIPSLIIQSDTSEGPELEQQAAFKTVLSVCQDIASQAADLGTNLYFDIVPLASGQFEFRTYIGAIGADRTYGSANPLVIRRENIQNSHLKWDYREEKTYVFATGDGSGSGILLVEDGNDARAYSMWGHIEDYINLGGEASNETYIEGKISERLQEGKAKIILDAEITNIPGSQYGIDYRYGDRLSVSLEGYVFDSIISSVTINFRNGVEKVLSEVTGEVTI